MRYLRLTLIWAVFGLALCPRPAGAAEAPASADELARRLAAAMTAKSKDALLALVYWEGADEGMKSMQREMMPMMFQTPVKGVKLVPLPADFQSTFERDGSRYAPTLPLVGLIEVEYTTPGNTMQQGYGQKDGKFYLPSMAAEKIAGAPAVKDKQLAINVSVAAVPTGTFEGSYVYVRSGKEVTEPLVDKDHFGAIGKVFWGDHFKSCTVRKISTGGEIRVELKEDGKDVFLVEGEKTDRPIVYDLK